MKLKQLRRAKGESQQELADATGVTQNTISRLERGEREARVSTLRKLADHFGVSVAELLGEADLPKSEGPSAVSRLLLDGPGHDFLTHTPEQTVEAAARMSVPAILVRLQDLSSERAYLRSLKASEFENPKAATAEIRRIRRNYVPNVMELVSAAERKVEAAALPDEEVEKALTDIERATGEAFLEANAPV